VTDLTINPPGFDTAQGNRATLPQEVGIGGSWSMSTWWGSNDVLCHEILSLNKAGWWLVSASSADHNAVMWL